MKRFVAPILVLITCSCFPGSEQAVEQPNGESPRVTPPPLPVIAIADEPESLCPPLAKSASSAGLWSWILPSLVRIEVDPDGRSRFVGDLAISWTIEGEGRLARFVLRKDRFWEDSTVVGIDDVVASYRLYLEARRGTAWSDRLEGIESVRRDPSGAHAVLFRFDRGLARSRILQFASLPIISALQWAQEDGHGPQIGTPANPILTAGSYRILEWRPADSMTLERHPFPPPGRSPRSHRIQIRFVPSGQSRVILFEQGLVDLAIDLPLGEVLRLRGQPEREDLIRAGPERIETLLFNLEDPQWGWLALRRSIADMLDRERLVTRIAKGDRLAMGNVPVSFLRPPDRAISLVGPRMGADLSGIDSMAARALPGRSQTVMELLYNETDGWREQAAVEITLQLRRLGIDCQPIPVSAAECAERVASGRYQAALIGWSTPVVSDIGDLFRSDGPDNLSGLRDASIDSLIDLARSTVADTTDDLWSEVESRALSRIPFLLLAQNARIDGRGPRLVPFRPDRTEPIGNLIELRFRSAGEASITGSER